MLRLVQGPRLGPRLEEAVLPMGGDCSGAGHYAGDGSVIQSTEENARVQQLLV